MKIVNMDIIDVMGLEEDEWLDLTENENLVVLSEFPKHQLVNVVLPAPPKRIWSFYPKFSFTYKLVEDREEDLYSIERSIKNRIRRKGWRDPRVFKNGLLDDDVVSFSTYERAPFGRFISKLMPYGELDSFLMWLKRNLNSLVNLSCGADLYKSFSSFNTGAFSSVGFEKDLWVVVGALDSDKKYLNSYCDGYRIEDVVINIRRLLHIMSVIEDDFKKISLNEFIGKYYFSIEMGYRGDLEKNFNLPAFIDDSGVAMSLIEKRVGVICNLNIPHFYDAIFNERALGMNVMAQFDYLLGDNKNGLFFERLSFCKNHLRDYGGRIERLYGDIFGY